MRLLLTALACLISVSVFGQNVSETKIKEQVVADINNDGTKDELSILSNSENQTFLEVKVKDALRKTIRTYLFELILIEENLSTECLVDATDVFFGIEVPKNKTIITGKNGAVYLLFKDTCMREQTAYFYKLQELDNKIKITEYFEKHKYLSIDQDFEEASSLYSFIEGRCVYDFHSLYKKENYKEYDPDLYEIIASEGPDPILTAAQTSGYCSKKPIVIYDKIDLNYGLNLNCTPENHEIDAENLKRNISFQSSDSNFNITSIAVIPQEIKTCDGSVSSADALASFTETNILSHYNVTDRRHLEAILEEHRLQMSGLTFEKTLLESGCIENAQAYLFVQSGCLMGDEIIEIRLVHCETSTLVWSCTGINASPQDVLAKIKEELSE